MTSSPIRGRRAPEPGRCRIPARPRFEAGTSETGVPTDGCTDSNVVTDTGTEAAVDGGKILPSGLADPIPYLSRADSPFNGVAFPSYFHFEDWEDGLVNTPGVTPSSTDLGGNYGALVDSIDGDDGVLDGKCEKAAGTCNSGFSGTGSFELTFDAAVLGALPTHVGIAWTDGSTKLRRHLRGLRCRRYAHRHEDGDRRRRQLQQRHRRRGSILHGRVRRRRETDRREELRRRHRGRSPAIRQVIRQPASVVAASSALACAAFAFDGST